MAKTSFNQLPFLLIASTALLTSGCGAWRSTAQPHSAASSAATPLAAETNASAIRFLEERTKRDPADFIALNKLADYYLLRLRETGNATWLNLAKRTAQASLKAIPAEQNPSGLSLLTQAEFSAHNFAAARDHAQRLIALEPRKGYPYQLLGDALLELGDYQGAEQALREMNAREHGSVATATRQARLAALKGEHERARQLYDEALQRALELVPPARETLAWCRWQLGDTAFNVGAYETAEHHYRAALVTFPDYYRALGGLARVRAARGAVNEGIELYQRAIKIVPEPIFVAALGDLLKLAGRAQEAEAQYALVTQMAQLGAANGALYDRQLALFYADHDLKTAEAYQIAKREYAARQDVYGADALAWAALKAGKLVEAQQASKEALRLGTQDAKLFYHTGMIAQAAGDKTAARDYLQRALQLNPQFDPLQAQQAQQALAE